MRITPNITSQNALYNLQQGRSKLDSLQEQVASGVNYSRPSDEPIITQQLLNLQDKVTEGDQYSSNIIKANTWLKMTDTALGGMSDILAQVRKVAGTIVSGSSDPTTQANTISQLDELKKQLVDMGNTQFGDQYLFAGFSNNNPPFSTAANTYGGTSDAINVEINKGSQMAMNITGDNLLTGGGGTVNILQQIDALKTAIGTNNVPSIKAAATLLDQSTSQIDNARGDVAAKLIRTQNAQNMIAQNKSTLSGIMSGIQNVDMIKVATELNAQQTAFQAALSATAKISQLSLLDYLK